MCLFTLRDGSCVQCWVIIDIRLSNWRLGCYLCWYSNRIPIVNRNPGFSLDGALPASSQDSGLHNAYRFDVNIPHILTMRPPTRLRRGGVAGGGGRRPHPCKNFGVCGMCKSSWYHLGLRNRSGERSPAGIAGAAGPRATLVRPVLPKRAEQDPPGGALPLQTNPPERLLGLL